MRPTSTQDHRARASRWKLLEKISSKKYQQLIIFSNESFLVYVDTGGRGIDSPKTLSTLLANGRKIVIEKTR